MKKDLIFAPILLLVFILRFLNVEKHIEEEQAEIKARKERGN